MNQENVTQVLITYNAPVPAADPVDAHRSTARRVLVDGRPRLTADDTRTRLHTIFTRTTQ